jgi:hypothetical protein
MAVVVAEQRITSQMSPEKMENPGHRVAAAPLEEIISTWQVLLAQAEREHRVKGILAALVAKVFRLILVPADKVVAGAGVVA